MIKIFQVFNMALVISLVMVQGSCAQTKSKIASPNVEQVMKQYGSGQAEVNVYDLKQNRYNDVRQGNLTAIWVTEPFLLDKQVKNESNTSKNTTDVLKNIRIKKFNTGVYDYTISMSLFTPINRKQFPNTPKVSCSSLEWCGQTFSQLNLKGDQYTSTLFSYFEQEGDNENKVNASLLEDELYSLIRMDASLLPEGSIELIPSLSYLRLIHKETKAYKATAKVNKYEGGTFKGEELKEYVLSYPSLRRSLKIIFESSFPHQIVGWTDEYPSVFDQKIRSTVVTLKETRMLDYWNMHGVEDEGLRKELGL